MTSVEGREACGALVSLAASGEGLNVPENMTPLAWTGRKPGCTPPES